MEQVKKLTIRIKFKSNFLKENDNKVTYKKDNAEFMKLSNEDGIIYIVIPSDKDFPEVIGYFNLDEIESIQFK